MSEMKSLTLNDKQYDGFVDPVARELAGATAVIKPASGESITLPDASGSRLYGLTIYGKTTQDGTPTLDAPVELVSVGDVGGIDVTISGDKNSQSLVVDTPNGLPGIPVTSGGNYTDANGQQWVCDEVDFARGMYVQRTEKVDMGTLSWGYDSENERFFSNGLNNKVKRGTRLTRLMTSVGYDCKYSSEPYAKWDNAVYVAGPTLYIHDANYATLESFTAAISGAMLLYPFETQIETPLSEDELVAYNALRTYRGTTTVTNDSQAYMELEYAMDTKTYIDSLFAKSVKRLASVNLPASAWVGSGNLYSQVVNIAGVTENSQVNLTPSMEQLSVFYDKDITFVTENDGGVVTVYVIGQKPQNDYTIQANIVEVVE